MSELLQARKSFTTRVRGQIVYVHTGDVADPSNPVVQALPDAFRPIRVKFPAVEAKSRKKADPAE